ncbi:unnamed protein product [Callosobruchus maculatus]|uniref:Uncharacterized protein n=1 Tax=Callosobruchus maculatus TaxID=64391 RepID=A0A653CCR9_CALMS|nr:unnamed protein product [Callosobruchus maculatus]
MERRRGSFSSDSANIWITNLLQQWQDMGNDVGDLVIVCDNAPCQKLLYCVWDRILRCSTPSKIYGRKLRHMLKPIFGFHKLEELALWNKDCFIWKKSKIRQKKRLLEETVPEHSQHTTYNNFSCCFFITARYASRALVLVPQNTFWA